MSTARPSPDAFRTLLDWLDEGADSGGERYLEMHRRLVSYFTRRNCLTPRELADETLTRVSRRLEETSGIDVAPAQYCYITARFVFLEDRRRAEYRQRPLDEFAEASATGGVTAVPAFELGDEEREDSARLRHLESCLARLDARQRELIREYYHGERREKIERRRNLAERFGLTMNALSIRACRIREKLEECLATAMKRPA